MNFNEVDQLIRTIPPDQIINELMIRNCHHKKQFPKSMTIDQLILNQKGNTFANLLTKINTQLSKKEPIIINYNSSDLLKNKTSGSSHFSLIVAQKFNPSTNKCEYLIRNSWGSTDIGYNPNIVTEKGHQWIDEDFLSKNIYEVIAIKK